MGQFFGGTQTLGPGFFGSKTIFGSGPTPLIFTNRGKISTHPIVSLASDTSGNTLALDSAGTAFLSVDGGHTFSTQGSIGTTLPTFAPSDFYTHAGTWIVAALRSWRSTNLGVTWTQINYIPNPNTSALGTDFAGNWVAIANATPANTGFSTNDGVSWTINGSTFGTGAFPPANIIWDGSQWICPGINAVTGQFFTSPDAITWTIQPLLTQTATIPDQIYFIGGVYYTADFNSAHVWQSSTFAGLLTPNLIAVPVDASGIQFILKGGVNWIALDFLGGVASSTNFTTWLAGTLNLATGENSFSCAYDSTHNSIIVGGNQGSITTYP